MHLHMTRIRLTAILLGLSLALLFAVSASASVIWVPPGSVPIAITPTLQPSPTAVATATPQSTATPIPTPTPAFLAGVKDLTESSATTFAIVTVASNSWAGGKVIYTIEASDGTNHQIRSAALKYSVTNKAGTMSCQVTTEDGTAGTTINETTDGNAFSITSGTLTYAVTCATGAGLVNIQANAVSSLTQTSLRAYYKVFENALGAVTAG